MKNFRCLVSVAAAALMLGCASGQMYSQVKTMLPSVPQENGRIYFYRNSAAGAMIQPTVRVNDQIVGTAKPLGVYYVDLPPGEYTVSTTTEVKRTLSLTLDNGQTRYVKLAISFGFFVGHVYPELVDNTVGEAEIATCHYIGTLPQANKP